MFLKRRLATMQAICLSLVACASQPDEINRYLLHQPTALDRLTSSSTKEWVVLRPLQLADYLQSQHIVMQLNSSKLQFSNKHRWAESLQTGIEKELLQQLRLQASGVNYLNRQQQGKAPAKELFVNIDHFLITEDSKVIISGDYWIKLKKRAPELHSFNISHALNKDGYEHAIQKLRGLISELASRIHVSVAKDANAVNEQ